MNRSAKELFQQYAYNQFASAIMDIDQNERPIIYALSCWYFLDNDDPRYPKLILGYNTTQHAQTQLFYASDEIEAKWNYAFWLQNELASIGGVADAQLIAWFQQTPFYYSQVENDAAETNNVLFDKHLTQSEQFNNEFIEACISLIQQLFKDGIIADAFDKDIPVLLHELEYYEEPLNWTLQANPPGVADEFWQAFQNWML